MPCAPSIDFTDPIALQDDDGEWGYPTLAFKIASWLEAVQGADGLDELEELDPDEELPEDPEFDEPPADPDARDPFDPEFDELLDD